MADSQSSFAQLAAYFAALGGRPASHSNLSATPRLPDGPHWGVIEGFEPLRTEPFDREARADALMNLAAARGADIARVQVDWADLETSPGVYDQDALDTLLEKLTERDQSGFVTLSTLDSEGFTIPDYLLAPGLSLTSDTVRTAFDAFLDWFVPQLTARGVWGLAIGNEVEIPVEDAFVTEDEAARFLIGGLARVRALDPDIAATVTLTAKAAEIAPALTQRLAEAVDIFSVNFYGDGGDGDPSAAAWASGLERIKAMAAGKPVFFQELGMPVGFEAAGLPGEGGIVSSLQIQEDFFAFMGRRIALDDQLLGATVFQLFDWSPELVESFVREGLNGGDPALFSQFAEALATIGLVAWADGETRPAWEEWLSSLETAAAIRDLRAAPVLVGDSGADRITPDDVGRQVFARGGDDIVVTGRGDDAVDLGGGDDSARLGGGNDIALGRRGDDEIAAGGGRDWAHGGAGRDSVSGGGGGDTLIGGAGDDRVFGDKGRDLLLGRAGDDRLFGGKGRDSLTGGDGADTLVGGAGHDRLSGLNGGDRLQGKAGDDHLFGGDGRDRILAGPGDDLLDGGAKRDVLNGGRGDDTIMAGPGRDRLSGGAGVDLLIGGAGADVFVFRPGDELDLIADFDLAFDQIALAPGLLDRDQPLSDALASISTIEGGVATLNFGGGDVLEITEMSSLEALWANVTLL